MGTLQLDKFTIDLADFNYICVQMCRLYLLVLDIQYLGYQIFQLPL